jgi:glycosyltransferase involved in cell wall biosynthesis
LLANRPSARVVIVGGGDVGYGAAAPGGVGWKDRFVSEIRPQLTDAQWARVHFVGRVPREALTRLLQISTVHVYLTYPFVLSWSLIEAMSIGCAVVASDTAPLHEVIRNGENGLLVPFFDHQALAQRVTNLLANQPERRRLGAAARATAVAHYDLMRVCLPQQLSWANGLAQYIGHSLRQGLVVKKRHQQPVFTVADDFVQRCRVAGHHGTPDAHGLYQTPGQHKRIGEVHMNR